jgi:hypothetical protein
MDTFCVSVKLAGPPKISGLQALKTEVGSVNLIHSDYDIDGVIRPTDTQETPPLLARLSEQFADVYMEDSGLGRTALMNHMIDTGDTAPLRSKPYRLGYAEDKALQKMLTEHMHQGFIRLAIPTGRPQFSSDRKEMVHIGQYTVSLNSTSPLGRTITLSQT